MTLRIFMTLLLLVSFGRTQAEPRLTPSFEPSGHYRVGFRTITRDDPGHMNNLMLNIPDLPRQRRILIHVWYPTQDDAGNFQHAAYWKGSSPYEKAYLEAYDRFRRLLFYQETFPRTAAPSRTPLPPELPPQPQAFQRQISGKLQANPTSGRFPILFYHSGAQGGFEENAPLLEYLTQHGYVCVAVLGSSNFGDIDASWRSREWKWNDLMLALEALKNEPYADPARIGLIGFSDGAQSHLSFAMKQRHFQASILLDTTYEIQDFQNFKNASLQEVRDLGHTIETPTLILSAIDVDFKNENRFRIYEPITRAPRVMVDFGRNLLHDDFTWHGMIQRTTRTPVDAAGFKQAMDRYEFIGQLSLKFLQEAFSSKPTWTRLHQEFQAPPWSTIHHDIKEGISSTVGLQSMHRLLQGDVATLRTRLADALRSKSIDPTQLFQLVSHVRYTDSSLKALQICQALPSQAVTDELECAVIALENGEHDEAAAFVKNFLKHHKKPKKSASGWEHVNFADVAKIQKMIDDGKRMVK